MMDAVYTMMEGFNVSDQSAWTLLTFEKSTTRSAERRTLRISVSTLVLKSPVILPPYDECCVYNDGELRVIKVLGLYL